MNAIKRNKQYQKQRNARYGGGDDVADQDSDDDR
jgi:hypothetical protein